MRPGVTLGEFEDSVLDVFGFLLTEEDFHSHRSDRTQYVYRVDFTRKGMLVRFEYSLRNDTISVEFFKHPESISTVPKNYDEASGLGTLLAYKGFPFSHYDSMNPHHAGGIKPSLEKLVVSFREQAMSTIRGEDWISLNMLREKRQSEGLR